MTTQAFVFPETRVDVAAAYRLANHDLGPHKASCSKASRMVLPAASRPWLRRIMALRRLPDRIDPSYPS